jgi:hypothetical protein
MTSTAKFLGMNGFERRDMRTVGVLVDMYLAVRFLIIGLIRRGSSWSTIQMGTKSIAISLQLGLELGLIACIFGVSTTSISYWGGGV